MKSTTLTPTTAQVLPVLCISLCLSPPHADIPLLLPSLLFCPLKTPHAQIRLTPTQVPRLSTLSRFPVAGSLRLRSGCSPALRLPTRLASPPPPKSDPATAAASRTGTCLWSVAPRLIGGFRLADPTSIRHRKLPELARVPGRLLPACPGRRSARVCHRNFPIQCAKGHHSLPHPSVHPMMSLQKVSPGLINLSVPGGFPSMQQNYLSKHQISMMEKIEDSQGILFGTKYMIHMISCNNIFTQIHDLSREVSREGSILYLRCQCFIKEYIDEVFTQLKMVCDSKTEEFLEKLAFMQKTELVFGRTSLLLSGGASLGVFHVGMVKTLMEHQLLPQIVARSSVSSVMCAIVATRSWPELEKFLAIL